MVWDSIKKKLTSALSTESGVELGEDYVELEADVKDTKSKVLIRPFTLTKYDDIREVLNAIREGTTIALMNIGPLKEKDITELKRAVDKVKKTVDANEGDIAGFGENFLVVTPSFARVWRAAEQIPAAPQAPAPEEL